MSPREFKIVSFDLLRKPNQRSNWTYSRRGVAKKWSTYFGIQPEVASEVWNKLLEKGVIPGGGKPKHLLYGYVLLMRYAGDEACGQIVGCHSNTFRKWAWKFIPLVFDLHHQVIRLDNRLNGWNKTESNTNMVMDATTFGVNDSYPFDSKMWDVKRSKAGLKYLVAHAISNGNIVYWSGWHKGSKSDIKMFKEELMGLMDEDECIEADAGCSGKFCIKNPNTAKTRRAKQQKGIVRARQETIFCKMKKFKCLRDTWIHSYEKHRQAVGAILVSLQLGLELGTVSLWDVEYEVEYF